MVACFFSLQAIAGSGNGGGVLFEKNKNQWPEQVHFQTRVANAQIFFEKMGLTYLLTSPEDLDAVHTLKHSPANDEASLDMHYHAFRMDFIGANNPDRIQGLDKIDYYRNYFLGNDPAKWASRVDIFQSVRYEELYNDIDALFYSSENNFKYDLIVKAGGNPADIVMSYQGLDGLQKDGEKLDLQNSVVDLKEMAPFAYQSIDNEIVQVPCFFEVNGSEVRFNFPEGYDTTRELVIDPTLIFATMTGSISDNWGTSATNDVDGNLVGCGMAFGTNYPTTLGAFQQTFGGAVTDMSIIKYNADGTDALFSTYIGGESTEFPHSSIVNDAGEIIIMGTTGSPDFPMLPQSYNSNFGGGSNVTIVPTINYPNGSDIVVLVLSADGSSLNASTYLGGSGNDGLNTSPNLSFNYADGARGEVNLDSDENIYVTSSTESSDFPITTGAFQQLFGGGSQDGVVVKLNNDLSSVLWSTYIGGLAEDAVYSSKVDSNNDLYVTGGTNSSDLPTFGGTVNTSFQGGDADGFISHLDGNDGFLINTTFLGTNDYDQSYLLDLDEDDNVYVVGQSVGGYPVTFGVYSDPGTTQFLHKLTPDLGTTLFSTVFGEGDEVNISPTAFLVDECNRIYVSGWGGLTQGSGNGSAALIGDTNGMFVSDDAIQPTTDGSDFYLILFEPDASGVNYATYFGSSDAREHVDGGTSRFDKTGVIYQAVCAGCGGNSFPTTPGVWSEENGAANCNLGAFKFAFEQDLVIAEFSSTGSDCASLSVSFQNESTGGDSYFWDFGDGNTSTEENPVHTYATAGTYVVQLNALNPATCNEDDAAPQQVIAVTSNADAGTLSGGGLVCSDGSIAATSNGDAVLQDGQSLVYIISDSPTPTASDILASNASGTFSLADGLESGVDYFIVAVIGDANGNIDFDDPCATFSPPVNATWLNPLVLDFENFCDEATGEFSVTVFAFGGLPEFDGSDYEITGDGNFSLAPGEAGTVAFGSFDGQSYSFSATDELGCNTATTSPQISCIKNPIKLIAFHGESRNNGNLLLWTTASETENDFFKIQRSTNGNSWQTMGQVKGAGNSLEELNYQFLDSSVSTGGFYYRLQAVDYNGVHESSDAIFLDRENAEVFDFNVYPSPMQDYLILSIASEVESAEVQILDISGKKVFQSSISKTDSGNTLQINTSNLPSGIYVVHVSAGLQSVFEKVVKE